VIITPVIPSMLMYVNLYSTDENANMKFLFNFAGVNMIPELQRINGIGQARILGSRQYAMRVWLNPDRMRAYSVSPDEVMEALNDQSIIGKPVHREEAVSILFALSGEKHKVITGVVIRKGEREISFADVTEVEFHKLTLEQIEFYVDKYKPYDKAGAYAIQEWIGVVGIKSINGDFYNVMGLPVSRVVRALEEIDG